jgi:O-antigen/teichoic acid export membrane protein
MVAKFLQSVNSKIGGRSKIVVLNATISLLLKGFSILIGFVFVPIYLNSVGQRQYGIILTITSISSFISFFDIGIGNGLRSKLGKSIADGNKELGRRYVSTAYFYVTTFFSLVFIAYCLVAHWIHWYKILNIPTNEIKDLDKWIFIVLGCFTARFVLQLIGNVLMADQKSFINDSMQFVISLGTLLACLLLKGLNRLDFYSLLVTTCLIPVFVLSLYSIIFFSTKYRWLSPKISFIDHHVRKDLLSLGFKFFIIQIVSLVIFSTTNILIAQLFNIGEVTRYNIAFKYYNITVMIFTILMSPLWGAFTHAWFQNDLKWIRKNIINFTLIVLGFAVVNILQFFLYPFFIKVWLKQEFAISGALVISFVVYNFFFCFNNILSHFLASIGNVNKQVYAAVAGGIINIPITIYLAKYTNLGLSSILFANIICLLPSTVVTLWQTIKLLSVKT